MDNHFRKLTRFSLEHLYTELEKPLYNVVFRYVWDRNEAQDLVQEAFIKLWKIRDKVEMDTVRPLIYRICLNLASSRIKRKKILAFLPLERVMKEPASEGFSLEKKEEVRILKNILNELPSRLKQTVLLTEFSDMSYDEVGKVLGIPSGTVGSRRNSAIKIMKEKFNSIYGINHE